MAQISMLVKQTRRWCRRQFQKLVRAGYYWRDSDWCKDSSDLFTVLSATKRFINNDVPGLLDAGAAMVPLHVELPLTGSQSLTVIVTAAEKRAMLRVYPLVKSKLAKAHVRGAKLLAEHGVNVPQILFSGADEPKYGAIFILEEFIEGDIRRASSLTSANIAAMASQLARMHSVRNAQWGRVMMERDEDFFLPLNQRVKRDLETLQKQQVLNGTETGGIQEWVNQWKTEFDNCKLFSLTHNDLQPANAIFTAEGDYYLIDLNRLQWGPAAREVVRCYHRQLDGDPEMIAEFDNTYYAALAPDDARETRKFCRFYEVFHRISTLVKTDDKSRKVPELQARIKERQKVLLEELMTLVENRGAGA